MRRLVMLWAVLALVATACGGSDQQIFGGPAIGSDDSLGMPADPAATIVTTLGGRTAVEATFLAIDFGYDVDQIASSPENLRADGTMDGVIPRGSGYGLISDAGQALSILPTASVARAWFAPPSTEHSLDEAWQAAEVKFGSLAVVRGLGVPLGLESDPLAASSNTTDGAKAMLGVILGLMDVGYSFDQALNGYLFGEWEVAVGVDPTDETFTGMEIDGKPLALSCLVLVDDAGYLIEPELEGSRGFALSPTCRAAMDAGTMVVYTGNTDPTPATTTTTTTTTTTQPPASSEATLIYQSDGWMDDLRVRFWDGSSRSVGWPVGITLELYPDGVATIRLEYLPRQLSFNCDAVYVALVEASEGATVTSTGTHASGDYSFPDLGLAGRYGIDGQGNGYATGTWFRPATTSDGCPQGPIEIERTLFFSMPQVNG